MNSEKFVMTKEHEAKLEPWTQKWLAHALETAPYTDEDVETIKKGMTGLYRVAKYPVPERWAICSDPILGNFAAGVAAGYWYVLNNPKSFEEKIFEDKEELVKAVHNSCYYIDQKIEYNSIVNLVEKLTGLTLKMEGLKPEKTAITKFIVECAGAAINMMAYGNQSVGLVAWISFFKNVVKLDEDWTDFEPYEIMGVYGPRWMSEYFWMVCERPTILKLDERNVLHNPAGPAQAWSSGFAQYYWRGNLVPKEWITSPSTLDPKIALTHENVELRRCAAEIIGWDKVISSLNPKVIHADPNPEVGTLLEVNLNGERERFLKVKCGTGRTFALPVPPEMKTAAEANAWTYNLDMSEFTKLEGRT